MEEFTKLHHSLLNVSNPSRVPFPLLLEPCNVPAGILSDGGIVIRCFINQLVPISIHLLLAIHQGSLI